MLFACNFDSTYLIRDLQLNAIFTAACRRVLQRMTLVYCCCYPTGAIKWKEIAAMKRIHSVIDSPFIFRCVAVFDRNYIK